MIWSKSHSVPGPPGPDRLEGGGTVLQTTPRAARAPFHGISPGRQLSGQAPPRNTQESEAAVWGWPWPCPGTAGPPRLQEGHRFTCWGCSRLSPPLPCQAAGAGEGAWVPAALKGLNVLALSTLPHPGPWLLLPGRPTLPEPQTLSVVHSIFLILSCTHLPLSPASEAPSFFQASLFSCLSLLPPPSARSLPNCPLPHCWL